MLAYVFTDANLPAAVLGPLLRRGVNRSFNAITVDGDTSTNDTCLLFATGAARHRRIARTGDRRLLAFRAALEAVLTDLAQQIVRDGEGAHKLVSITVRGAASEAAARKLGLAIANSPLVKTAIAGEDPNWGRIVAVVGRAGVAFDQAQLSIWIGGERAADEWRGGSGLRRAGGGPPHEGAGGRDRRRDRLRPRRCDRLDLRPDPRLHRHQCRLPLLTRLSKAPLRGRRRSSSWLPSRWWMPTAACCWRAGRRARRWKDFGNSPVASSLPRNAGAGADPRAPRGTRNRHGAELPRAFGLRLSQVR